MFPPLSPLPPQEAPKEEVKEKAIVVLNRSELKLNLALSEYSDIERDNDKARREKLEEMLPMLARATQQRGDRIDELGEVIDVHLLVSELARYLTDTLNDATLHGPGLVAEALVRLSQNDGLACAANMATSPLASRLISMASVPSQLVEALTQLVELDLETMGDSGVLVRDAESRAASVLCALGSTEATVKDLCSTTNGMRHLFQLMATEMGPGSGRIGAHAAAVLWEVSKVRLSGKQVAILCEQRCIVDHISILRPAPCPPFTMEYRMEAARLPGLPVPALTFDLNTRPLNPEPAFGGYLRPF